MFSFLFFFLLARESFSWLEYLNMKRLGSSCDNKNDSKCHTRLGFPFVVVEMVGRFGEINATDGPGVFQ